jgi:hypothetical protein
MIGKTFNVTLIQPPDYEHSLALEEAADYLHATLLACGYPSVRTTNRLAADAYNVILCAHLLRAEDMPLIPSDSIVFNSEELYDVGGWHFHSGAYREILKTCCVWDYAFRNLALIPHEHKSLIPFRFCAALRRADAGRADGGGRSLLFYGSITPRRRQVLDALQARGIEVETVFGVYGARRDEKMFRSWAVLNVHKGDADAFEPIRCFYPLINEVAVVSEDAGDGSADAFRDSVHFFNPDALADGIHELRANQARFRERSREMFACFERTSPLEEVRVAVEGFLSRWQ